MGHEQKDSPRAFPVRSISNNRPLVAPRHTARLRATSGHADVNS